MRRLLVRERSHVLSISLGLFVSLALLASGCDGKTLDPPPITTDPDADLDASALDAADAADTAFDDGTPVRLDCVDTLGTALTPDTHGRLDGQLVSIVTAGHHCPSDATHLHLQVMTGGAVYDIAVNLDGFEGELDAPMPGIPFADGFHPMDLDYVSAFGLHSTSITLTGEDAIRARLVAVLAYANHLSVFGTSYPDSTGAHLIHRNGVHADGALVIDPSAPKAHIVTFRFASDTF